MTIVLLQDLISAELHFLCTFHIKQRMCNIEYEICEKQGNKHVIEMQFIPVGKWRWRGCNRDEFPVIATVDDWLLILERF